jgi:hypothetical protein
MADDPRTGIPVHVAGTADGVIHVDAEAINSGHRWLVIVKSPRTLLMRIEFEAQPEPETDVAVPGSRGYSPEHWQRIAELYREAQESTPRSPVGTVARQVGRSEATVGRWLRTMRKQGLLTDPSE